MSKFIENLPYSLDEGLSARASVGLVVLATDYTIEAEWRVLFNKLPGVALYHARIANDDEVTPETLKAMAPRIAATAATLTPGTVVDVVAYGCTSASMAIGEDVVFSHINEAKPGALCTTPVTAAFAAFKALGAKRIAVLTPYSRSVNEIVVDYLQRGGVDIPVFGSFNEPLDSRVSRISDESVAAGVRTLVNKSIELQYEIDAVFVSCTSVRLMAQCASLEQEIGLPITSSNHAMAWHALRLAGIEDSLSGLGKLYDCVLT
ncbi:MAG: hypothetical protein AB8B79_15180 [Granulosicoccus sp.]